MYKIEYLLAALQDMTGIVSYISRKLCNPDAAENLAGKLVGAADMLADFPYANPLYIPIKPLRYEYRKLLVENYIMFYRVDELAKTVTIARVIYSGRDYVKLL